MWVRSQVVGDVVNLSAMASIGIMKDLGFEELETQVIQQ
jgi:hypothetical protein